MDLGKMQVDNVASINNVDIITLVSLIDAALRQASNCPSATTNRSSPQDVDILIAWTAHFEDKVTSFSNQPRLYMPAAHPKGKATPKPPEVNICQNIDFQHQMYQLSQLRTQLLNCEDTERLNSFDPTESEKVISPWLEKFKAYNTGMADTAKDENAAKTWWPENSTQEPEGNS